MEMQSKFVTKEEAHKLIDEAPGDTVMVIKYNRTIGMSDHGKRKSKKMGKRYVDKSSAVVLIQNNPITTLNLHKKIFSDLSEYNKEETIRSILLPLFPIIE